MKDYTQAATEMIELIARRGVTDPRLLQAMRSVPRHLFVRPRYQTDAYADKALPSFNRQTISQPYVVAYMLDLLQPQETDIALEIGSGTGYAAAVLSLLTSHVHAVERIEKLIHWSQERITQCAINNITLHFDDGSIGLPKHAPYDLILVSAAATELPQPLLTQLKPNGRLLIPIGPHNKTQTLFRYTKLPSGEISQEELIPVRFVPLIPNNT